MQSTRFSDSRFLSPFLFSFVVLILTLHMYSSWTSTQPFYQSVSCCFWGSPMTSWTGPGGTSSCFPQSLLSPYYVVIMDPQVSWFPFSSDRYSCTKNKSQSLVTWQVYSLRLTTRRTVLLSTWVGFIFCTWVCLLFFVPTLSTFMQESMASKLGSPTLLLQIGRAHV